MNSTNTTRLYRHHPHHLQREHQQKERKRTKTKTNVAIIFVVRGWYFYTNLVLKYPVFLRNVANIYNIFLCVAYGQYPNIF
jgi:hypothetical protein